MGQALQARLAPFILSAADQANEVQPRSIRVIRVPDYFAEYRDKGDGLASFLGTSIVAKVCTYLAENKINILDISQTIVQGYFNMMVIADISGIEKDFTVVCDEMAKLGDEIGVRIHCQREDIFEKMHRL